MRSVGWSGTRFSMTPSAKISNPHTRRAYARPVERFLAWCEEQGIELRQVTPGLAGTGTTGSVVKMRLPGSISRATALNLPSPTEAQRTDPARSDVSAPGNAWSMSQDVCPLASRGPSSDISVAFRNPRYTRSRS